MSEVEKKYVMVCNNKILLPHMHMVYRIKAIRDFGDVKKGDLGGYIEKESNLSHEGNCWIYGDAIACNDSIVCDNAKIYDDTIISGLAKVEGNAVIYGNSHVHGRANVKGDMKLFNVDTNATEYDSTDSSETSLISKIINTAKNSVKEVCDMFTDRGYNVVSYNVIHEIMLMYNIVIAGDHLENFNKLLKMPNNRISLYGKNKTIIAGNIANIDEFAELVLSMPRRNIDDARKYIINTLASKVNEGLLVVYKEDYINVIVPSKYSDITNIADRYVHNDSENYCNVDINYNNDLLLIQWLIDKCNN